MGAGLVGFSTAKKKSGEALQVPPIAMRTLCGRFSARRLHLHPRDGNRENRYIIRDSPKSCFTRWGATAKMNPDRQAENTEHMTEVVSLTCKNLPSFLSTPEIYA